MQFLKNFKRPPFYGTYWHGFKLSSHSLFKNMLKILIFDLNKRDFFKILPYIQSVAILVSQGLIS